MSGPRRRGVVAGIVVALVALASCSRRGDGTYQGYVEGDFVHVGSGAAGRLEKLLVARGETVAEGAALFELEAEQEAAAVRQSDEQIRAAEAQLADLETGKRRVEVEVLEAQLEQALAAE